MALLAANSTAQNSLTQVINEEKLKAAEERQHLLTQITSLVNATAEAQESRITSKIIGVSEGIDSAHAVYNTVHDAYNQDMDNWSKKSKELVSSVVSSRDSVKTKIKADFAVSFLTYLFRPQLIFLFQSANTHMTSLRTTTTSVHDTTVSIVAAQMSHMDTQLHSLDEIVSRVRAQNNAHHAAHTSSLGSLSSTVQSSYSSIGDHLSTSFARVEALDSDMAAETAALRGMLPTLASNAEIRAPLKELRDEIESQTLLEYIPTGETPMRTNYAYPSNLPRTEGHEFLISRLRGRSDSSSDPTRSPSKGMVFNDAHTEGLTFGAPTTASKVRPTSSTSSTTVTSTSSSLRELDINVVAQDAASTAPTENVSTAMPPLKKQNTNGSNHGGSYSAESKLPMKKGARMTVAGVGLGVGDRENLPVSVNFSASVGPGGRKLRSHGNG